MEGGAPPRRWRGGAASYVTMKEEAHLGLTSPSPVVGHQWLPDSRTYMVSTTSPRMNLDNGVHLYRCDGGLVDEGRLPWDNSWYRSGKLLFTGYVPVPTRCVCGLTTTGRGGRGPKSSRGSWSWRGAWSCGRARGGAGTGG